MESSEPEHQVDEEPEVSALSVSDPLVDLRAKMAKLMGDTALVEKPKAVDAGRAEAAKSDLPFVPLQLDSGTVFQRLETQRASAHVGRMPLSSALDANMEMLSLLALSPELAGCDPRKALYFDTETTGLGGAGALAFLVGLAWFDEEGQLVMEQLLLRDPGQEEALLVRFEELVQRSSMLVSFNGKSFDWPLMQTRRVMNRLCEMEKLPHLDLLHVSRRLHKRRLDNCRLIHLEGEVLGWERGEDDIPGAEIPARYTHFLRTGHDESLRAVIDHNAWDVLTMAALVGLYGEALEGLCSEDLLGLAHTLTRAKAYGHAEAAADKAILAGHVGEGLELRARLFKAMGDKPRALADFARLGREVDDPAIRLELAKLYEHHEKDFEQALICVSEGTGEQEEDVERRRSRLLRRVQRRERDKEQEGA